MLEHMAIIRLTAAINISAEIIVAFLSILSTKVPAMVPSSAVGRNPAIDAIDNTSAEPVSAVRYQINAI